METSAAYQTTVDTDTFHPRDPAPADCAEVAGSSQVLALPAPCDAAGGGGRGIQLGLGESVQMDHVGPMVVGQDGSLSRIANWDKLNEREREIALRRITARNRERLAELRAEPGQPQGAAEAGRTDPTAAAAAAAGGQQGQSMAALLGERDEEAKVQKL